MDQLPKFVAQEGFFGLVCHFGKYLCALKQSPKAWFGRFNVVVQKFDMTQSETKTTIERLTSKGRSIAQNRKFKDKDWMF